MTSQLPRFQYLFFTAGSLEKDTKNGAAVMSLRFFLFHDDFCNFQLSIQDFLTVNSYFALAKPVSYKPYFELVTGTEGILIL